MKTNSMVTKAGGNFESLVRISEDLRNAGFTAEQIELCNKRFMESPFEDYGTWCKAYIALNSMEPQSGKGVVLDGNVIMKALGFTKLKKRRIPFELSKKRRKR